MTSVPASPRCPHYGTCGGCSLQHIPYEQQLANKTERLAYLLSKHYQGAITTLGSEPYGYRNRIDFVWTSAGPSMRGVRGGTFPVTTCPITEPRVDQILAELKAWHERSPVDAFDPKRRTGTLRYAVVRAANDLAVSFAVNEDSTKLAACIDAIREFAANTIAEHVLVSTHPAAEDDSLGVEHFAVKGDGILVQDFLGVPVHYHAEAFFQNNTRTAEALVALVRDQFAQYGTGNTIVDAYGGVGTFAFALAPLASQIISVESHPLAKECLERTKTASGITNITAHTLDSAAMAKLNIPADALYLVDPPRSGMDPKVIRYLLQRAPRVIVYVSCNPAQLAKELELFAGRYRVTFAAAVDLFPQTNHCEAVVTLVRKD